MSEEKLTCTKVVRKDAGSDAQGRPVTYHEKCGKPASEYVIGGLLASAKAVLCGRHKTMADNQSYVSINGYPKGRVERKAKQYGYVQTRLPGSGVEKVDSE